MNIYIRYYILFFVFAGIETTLTFAQQKQGFTLEFCQQQSIINYPSYKDKAVLETISGLKIRNIESGKLPQVSVNGQATYQSEAIDITLPLPGGAKSIHQSKDQYKATLDVNQLLFDGGATSAQRTLEETSFQADAQQVEVDLQKVKEIVNNTYFQLLLLQKNKELLETTHNEINEKEKLVASSVKNGILMQPDLDVLVAERLKIEQQISEQDINRSSSLKILSLLINQPITDSSKFEPPVLENIDSMKIQRAEFKLFELQSKRLDDSRELTSTVLKPKLYAFGQAGYGKPGLNMLSDKFDAFYIVGANLKWTLWDWHKNNREKQVLEIQKQIVNNRSETFNRNLNIDLQNRLATINKLNELLKSDAEIVELRGRITASASSRLQNGVITSTDYLTELNAETIAKINFETHKIQLLQAKANYLLAIGR